MYRHFWESRFKSQALLTEEAVISCMAYVDLNPVRATIATTPEASEHTCIKERIAPNFTLEEAVTQQIDQQCLRCFEIPLKALSSFEGNVTEHKQHGVLFNIKDYIELIDYTGRIIRSDKKGSIPLHLPSILQRLNLDKKIGWTTLRISSVSSIGNLAAGASGFKIPDKIVAKAVTRLS